MDVTIRKARKADLPRLKAYSTQTYREHVARHPQAFPESRAGELDAHFDAAFRNASEIDFTESPNLLVAETEDHDLAGCILLSWWAGRPEGIGYVAQIEDIFTVPKHRNQGVARALLQTARTFVGVDGLHGLQAHVWAGTPGSDRLFQAMDFIPEYTVHYFGPARPSAAAEAEPVEKTASQKRMETWLGFGVIAFLLVLAATLGAAYL